MSGKRAIAWLIPAGSLGLAVLIVAATMLAAQTPSSALLVMLRISKQAGTVAVLDPASGKIVGRVRVAEDPHGVDVSGDGKTAFVANTSGDDGNSLSIVDLVSQKELRRLDFPGSNPHDVQVAGGKAYFTAAGRKAIGRYDPVRNQTDWLSTGSHATRMMAIDEARDTIYATSQSTKSVLILEGMSKAPSEVKLTAIPVGHEAEGIALSPDGKEAWTANNEAGVTIVDAVNKKVLQTLPVRTDHANRIAFSPDGRRVVLLDRDIGETIILDGVSKKELKRIKHSDSLPGAGLMGIFDVAIAADSSRAFVAVADIPDVLPPSRSNPVKGGKHHIAVIDLKTLEVTNRFPTEIPGDEMVWVQRR
jgi:DNA-binding beta-propeller fold protein YncE